MAFNEEKTMRYICQVCGYIYDDAKEKVPFDQLPENWKCPLCGASKSDFKKEETVNISHKEGEERHVASDMKELSVGQLSVLCSNLARGCEKQYKDEESKLFRQLAEYFDSIAPSENDATVENLYKELTEDVENYPLVRAVTDSNSDRGAARICVWGEKVTRMLNSLVGRYLKEGEAMLAGTSIWVCTVCGFVYIGDEAPILCPVCKVPSWKFEKIEGRA